VRTLDDVSELLIFNVKLFVAEDEYVLVAVCQDFVMSLLETGELYWSITVVKVLDGDSSKSRRSRRLLKLKLY